MQKIRGLYKITNECTGLFYIGKSTDIYKRWVNHKRDFEKGTHAGGAFQYDYDLFGKEAFKYEVLYENNSIINILNVYDEIEKNQIFGTKEIKEILDCSPSTARAVMTKLRDMKVVKAVNGKGKGKYVFIE